jgi:hypothetical protein
MAAPSIRVPPRAGPAGPTVRRPYPKRTTLDVYRDSLQMLSGRNTAIYRFANFISKVVT